MRQLVTIQKIGSLTPIKDADNIELAHIQGWQAIVRKNVFSVGDHCLFFEIDSFLPDIPEFAFIKQTTKYNGTVGYRIRTLKLKNTLSQGLVLPLDTFPGLDYSYSIEEQIGVIKYDAAVAFYEKQGTTPDKLLKPFPAYISKSEQERLQNLTSYFDTMQGVEFEETLKLDGTSVTVFATENADGFFGWLKKMFGFKVNTTLHICSRNYELDLTDVTAFKGLQRVIVTSILEMPEFKNIPAGFAVQGELCGVGVQGNYEKLDETEFYVYNVWDIEHHEYLSSEARIAFCHNAGLLHVPVIGTVPLFDVCTNIDQALERVRGCSINPNVVSEGRVYKSLGGSFSFKLINNDYALKEK